MEKKSKVFSLRARSRVAIAVLAAGTLLGLVPACSYSLGGRGELPFSSIEIAPIVNETDLPQSQAMLARNISDALNREPKLRTVVVSGDAELRIVISDYRRSISATSSGDSVLASTQNLTLDLKCTLADKRSGKFYFRDRSVSVSTEVYTGTSPGLGEPQSFPVLSREAARKIRDLVTSVW